MALLARCPTCDCELELPATTEQVPDEMQVECPACSHTFAATDTQPRTVQRARPIQASAPEGEPPTSAESPASVDLLGKELSGPLGEENFGPAGEEKFGATTLASFMQSDTPTPSDDQPESALESRQHFDLGDYKSLDDLFNRVGPGPIVPASDNNTPGADSTSETATIPPGDTAASNASNIDEPDKSPLEPQPAADRLRPTFEAVPVDSAAAPPSDETAAEAGPDKSNSIEASTRESIDDLISSLDDIEDKPGEREQAGDPLAETFDFGGTSDSAGEGSQGLRASMGFASNEVLEHEQVSIDTGEPDHDMSVGGVEPSSNAAPTRRRSSPSIARTMIGVVGGGVVALAISPLAVMWINHFRSVNLDPFGVAHFYPDVIKPAEFRSTATSAGDHYSPSPDVEQLAGNRNQNGNGVVPSTFETSDSNPNGQGPARWDHQETPSAPLPDDSIEVAEAPEYPAAKIMQWTSEAKQATKGLLKGSFDNEALRPAKGSSYAKIAMLADAVTFGEGPADASWLDSARQVFPPLFASEQSQAEVSLISSYWLTSKRRPHGGIFFCGQPNAGRQQGSVAEYVFTLPTPQRQELTVLVPNAFNNSLRAASNVAVIGSIVDNPAQRIEGYTGTAEQVIWSRYFFAVGQ